MELYEIIQSKSVITLNELEKLNPAFATQISSEFTGDDGNSMVDEIEVDETGALIEVGHRCTKGNCSCTGWFEKTGKRAYGRTLNIRTY